MYYDLNLKIENASQQPLHPDAQELILSCIEDGYAGIAINTHFLNITLSKAHENHFQPISTNIIEKGLEERKNLYNNPIISQNKFKQLSRITLTINDLKFLQQINDNNKILKTYDIIAIEPLDEKIFHSLCIDYDYYDIITFNITKKLPFHLKYPPIKEAIKKGKMFEINYSQALEDQSIRRMMMANAINLINYTKGKNLIFSSNCKNQLYHRSPFDLASLGINLGLKRDEAFFAVSKNAEKCIKQSYYRKTFKGTISLATPAEKNLFKEKQMQLNLIKKTKKLLIQQKIINQKKKIEEEKNLKDQEQSQENQNKKDNEEIIIEEQKGIDQESKKDTDINLQQNNQGLINDEIAKNNEKIDIEITGLEQRENTEEQKEQLEERQENKESFEPKKILQFTVDEG